MQRIMISTAACVCLLMWSCNKKAHDTAPQPATTRVYTFTSEMGKIRNWHGHHYYTASGPHFATPVNESWDYPDTSFAVSIIDDSTIQCMGQKYLYESSDSGKHVHYFGTAKYYYQYGVGTGSGVAYFYGRDSIVYLQQDMHRTDDSWLLNNIRYTY